MNVRAIIPSEASGPAVALRYLALGFDLVGPGESDVILCTPRTLGAAHSERGSARVACLAHNPGEANAVAPYVDLVVAPSEQLLRDAPSARPAAVVRPPVPVHRYATCPLGYRPCPAEGGFPCTHEGMPSRRDSVLILSLRPDRGAGTFLVLARHNPQVRFLAVRRRQPGQLEAPRLPNLEVMEEPEDVRDAYARARVLLMPSAYESFGRTALEAACSGVPTLAHPHPALRESIGPAASYMALSNPGGWRSHLTGLLFVPSLYERKSGQARSRAWALDDTTPYEQASRALGDLLARAAA